MQTCTGTDTHHHDKEASVAKDHHSLVTLIEDLGNPFEER